MSKRWYIWYLTKDDIRDYTTATNKATARKIAWQYILVGKYLGMYYK